MLGRGLGCEVGVHVWLGAFWVAEGRGDGLHN